MPVNQISTLVKISHIVRATLCMAYIAKLITIREDAFNEAIKQHQTVIIDFFATSCAPCKAISPVFDKFVSSIMNNTTNTLKLSRHSEEERFSDIYFAKIDVEDLGDLCDKLEVMAMPTFVLFHNGEKKALVVEPKPDKLLTLIEQFNAPER